MIGQKIKQRRNNDNTRLVGIFVFRVNKDLYYAPVFFINGNIKGTDLFYRHTTKSFVPATESWVEYLISLSETSEGKGVPIAERINTRRQMNLQSIVSPPDTMMGRKYASAAWEEMKQAAVTQLPADSILRKFITKDGGFNAIKKIASAAKEDPKFAEALFLASEPDSYMPELSLDIMAQFAPSPMGPWSDPVFLYATADQWDELNYAPNICTGTGANGTYTIGYSDNGSPEGLAKWASDKSYYNPHFITANLYNLSPYSISPATAGPGARLSLKFAADKDYGYDAIGGTTGAGPLNTSNWFNVYGADGASNGVTAVPFYTLNGLPKFASETKLVYNYAAEINSINTDTELAGNYALLDSFINVNNNCWYLSVTNLDPVFTNGYSIYFYYNGGAVGRGGQNYVRYYLGQTTNSAMLGLKQWNLYTTATNNGQFIQDLTSANTSASDETPGANYIVFTNLSGGAFDLLITNGNYGGLNALEIVANPWATSSLLTTSSNQVPFATTVTLTNVVTPPPPNGEPVTFMDGTAVLGTESLSGAVATFSSSTFSAGTHSLTAVYAGDADYLASTSGIVTLVVSNPPPIVINYTLIGDFAFQLSWNSLAQQVYQVESCTNLAAGVWLTNTSVQAPGTTTSVTVFKTGASQEFFRVTSLF